MKKIGVAKIFLYKSSVHPNIEKVINYYEREGFVQVTNFGYPPPYIDVPSIKRQE